MNPDFKKRFEEAFMLSGFAKLGTDERETIKAALWALKWGITEASKIPGCIFVKPCGEVIQKCMRCRISDEIISLISTEESK